MAIAPRKSSGATVETLLGNSADGKHAPEWHFLPQDTAVVGSLGIELPLLRLRSTSDRVTMPHAHWPDLLDRASTYVRCISLG